MVIKCFLIAGHTFTAICKLDRRIFNFFLFPFFSGHAARRSGAVFGPSQFGSRSGRRSHRTLHHDSTLVDRKILPHDHGADIRHRRFCQEEGHQDTQVRQCWALFLFLLLLFLSLFFFLLFPIPRPPFLILLHTKDVYIQRNIK